jgi:hypothetical protein
MVSSRPMPAINQPGKSSKFAPRLKQTRPTGNTTLAGILLAGQKLAPSTLLYSHGAFAGAVTGTAIGLRWMAERGTRYVLAAILLFAGIRLLFR